MHHHSDPSFHSLSIDDGSNNQQRYSDEESEEDERQQQNPNHNQTSLIQSHSSFQFQNPQNSMNMPRSHTQNPTPFHPSSDQAYYSEIPPHLQYYSTLFQRPPADFSSPKPPRKRRRGMTDPPNYQTARDLHLAGSAFLSNAVGSSSHYHNSVPPLPMPPPQDPRRRPMLRATPSLYPHVPEVKLIGCRTYHSLQKSRIVRFVLQTTRHFSYAKTKIFLVEDLSKPVYGCEGHLCLLLQPCVDTGGNWKFAPDIFKNCPPPIDLSKWFHLSCKKSAKTQITGLEVTVRLKPTHTPKTIYKELQAKLPHYFCMRGVFFLHFEGVERNVWKKKKLPSAFYFHSGNKAERKRDAAFPKICKIHPRSIRNHLWNSQESDNDTIQVTTQYMDEAPHVLFECEESGTKVELKFKSFDSEDKHTAYSEYIIPALEKILPYHDLNTTLQQKQEISVTLAFVYLDYPISEKSAVHKFTYTWDPAYLMVSHYYQIATSDPRKPTGPGLRQNMDSTHHNFVPLMCLEKRLGSSISRDEVNAVKFKHGRNLMHQLCLLGSTRYISKFIEKGGDIHAKDKYGCTPLHLAVFSGVLRAILALLKAGAKIDVEDNSGNTPESLARDLDLPHLSIELYSELLPNPLSVSSLPRKLVQNGVIPNWLVSLLARAKNLKVLDLSFSVISEEGFTGLARIFRSNKSIKRLNLYATDLRGKKMDILRAGLMKNKTLTRLDISGAKIGDEEVEKISPVLKKMVRVDLSDNSISDKGATVLANVIKSSCSLKDLNLYTNSIRHVGVKHISEALSVNSSLWKLRLSYNPVGDKGAFYLSNALSQSNKTLKRLYLKGTRISDDGAKQIAKGLKRNISISKLDLSSNNIQSKKKLIEKMGSHVTAFF